jgi:hypothetical protein
MFQELKRDLEAQKKAIEAKGILIGDWLELDIETYVVFRNDRWYLNGKFGFDDPDEMTKREAEAIAFKTGAVVKSAKAYWDRKYKSIVDALNRFDS